MTGEEFEILCTADVRECIDSNIERDPMQIALKLKHTHRSLIATQVKYLQRCKSKLPEHYAARCIIPPISYEQCSSAEAAERKAYSGELCIDLTCGLGVDALNFSKHFRKVITIERDPVLAAIAQYNFALLGAKNIDVVCGSAEKFTPPTKADLIYIDPARRDVGNRKVFLLEDCSPNVIELKDHLLQHTNRIVIKLSPLFDISQAMRIFVENISSAEIVSINGECKELLIELTPLASDIEIIANTSHGIFRFTNNDIGERIESGDPEPRYLLLPDAALIKGRFAAAYAQKHIDNELYIAPSGDFFLSAERPDRFCGRVFEIKNIEEYNPKTLKKELKGSRMNIIRRNFPLSPEQIARATATYEGGTQTIAFVGKADKLLTLRL